MAAEVMKESGADVEKYSEKAKHGMEWLKQRGQDLAKAVGSAFDTVTGKAALEEIAAYVQESEAVNTALATRIYELLDRSARLQRRLTTAERKVRQLICVGVAVNGITWVAITYLLLR